MNDTEKYVSFLLNKCVVNEKPINMNTFRDILRDVASMAFLDRYSHKEKIADINVKALIASYKSDIVNTMKKYDIQGIEDEVNRFDEHYDEFMDNLMKDDTERIYNSDHQRENHLFVNDVKTDFQGGENFTMLSMNVLDYCYTDGMFESNAFKYQKLLEEYVRKTYTPKLSESMLENMKKRENMVKNRSEFSIERLYKENLLGKNDIEPEDFDKKCTINNKLSLQLNEDYKAEVLKNITSKEMVRAYRGKVRELPSGQPLERNYVKDTLNDIRKLEMVHETRSGIRKFFSAIFRLSTYEEGKLIERLKTSLVNNSTSHNHPLSLAQIDEALANKDKKNELLSGYTQVWTEEKLTERHIHKYNVATGIDDSERNLQEEIGRELEEKENVMEQKANEDEPKMIQTEALEEEPVKE